MKSLRKRAKKGSARITAAILTTKRIPAVSDVTLKNIAKNYGELEIIRDINLNIRQGELVVFVGPSGSGKSTLLRMIAGLEDVTRGEIQIGGRDVTFDDPAHRGVAMVFQSYALYPHLSVRDNLGFSLRIAKVNNEEKEIRIQKAANILKMTELLDRFPKQLSGGQRQRVAIGRAIVRDPELFLFDEPLSNLDSTLREGMREELLTLHSQLKATMIYVTHDQVEAMTLADRMVVLDGGQVQQIGSPLELYHRPRNLFVATFLGSPKMNIVEAEVSEIDEKEVVLQVVGFGKIALKTPTHPLGVGDKLKLGIRPNAVSLDPQTGIAKTKVTLVERLGDFTICTCSTREQGKIVANLVGDQDISVGDECFLQIETKSLHCFSADTDGFALR